MYKNNILLFNRSIIFKNAQNAMHRKPQTAEHINILLLKCERENILSGMHEISANTIKYKPKKQTK